MNAMTAVRLIALTTLIGPLGLDAQTLPNPGPGGRVRVYDAQGRERIGPVESFVGDGLVILDEDSSRQAYFTPSIATQEDVGWKWRTTTGLGFFGGALFTAGAIAASTSWEGPDYHVISALIGAPVALALVWGWRTGREVDRAVARGEAPSPGQRAAARIGTVLAGGVLGGIGSTFQISSDELCCGPPRLSDEEIAARWIAAGLTVGFLAQWAWADELRGIPSPEGAVFGPSGDGGVTVGYSLGF